MESFIVENISQSQKKVRKEKEDKCKCHKLTEKD